MKPEIEAKALAVLRKLAACPLFGCEKRGEASVYERSNTAYVNDDHPLAERGNWKLDAADILSAREAVEALDVEPKDISIADSLAQIEALKVGMEAVIEAITKATPEPPAKPKREKKTLKGRIVGEPDESGEIQWRVVITEQSHRGTEFGDNDDMWQAPSGRVYRSEDRPEYYDSDTYVRGYSRDDDTAPIECPGLVDARTVMADFAAYERHFNGGEDAE